MSASDVWMPLHIADYLGDTAHLTTEEHGAYLLSRMSYWRSGPLPDDDRVLATICRIQLRRWITKVGPVIRAFYRTEDGKLHHKRAELERTKAYRDPAETSRRQLDVVPSRWAALRAAVFARDNYTCRYCSDRPADLECDHVVPFSRGGLSTMDNLAAACGPCNRSKSDYLVAEWLQ